jgi:hypothetical protein
VNRITRDGANDAVPSWSRDGRSVYFASNRTGSWQIFKAPAEGGAEVQITRDGGFAAFETFEGGTLLYTKFFVPGLFRVPVGGGPEVRVLDQPHCWGHFAVTRDGVLYLDSPRQGRPVVLFRKLPGGVSQEVATLEAAVPCAESSLTASPDRRFLFYTGVEETSDIVRVDGVR